MPVLPAYLSISIKGMQELGAVLLCADAVLRHSSKEQLPIIGRALAVQCSLSLRPGVLVGAVSPFGNHGSLFCLQSSLIVFPGQQIAVAVCELNHETLVVFGQLLQVSAGSIEDRAQGAKVL